MIQEAQAILKEKVRRADEILIEQRQQKKLYQSQSLGNTKKVERQNVFGVTDESKFTIIIHQGRGMADPLQYTTKIGLEDIPPFVLLNCGKREFKTKPGYSSMDCPQWDEEFSWYIFINLQKR